MNIIDESLSIFRQLRSTQKLVLLRIFIVINVGAFFLATKTYSDNEFFDITITFLIYAAENCFMLWLGYKRGIGFHRNVLASQGQQVVLAAKAPMARWYLGMVVVSVLLSTMALIAVGAVVDHVDENGDSYSTGLLYAFWVIEAIVMGFSLLQGLRMGWNAVVVSNDTIRSALTIGVDIGNSKPSPVVDIPLTAGDALRAQKRTQNIRRGQVIFGVVSIVCAILAIYFRVVAYEEIKHRSEDEAKEQALMTALGDAPTSQQPIATPGGTQERGQAIPEAGSKAALAAQESVSALQRDAIPSDGPALANALAIAANVAKEDPNDLSFINGEDDTSLQTPVFAGRISQGGYPVFALTCDVQRQQCSFHNGMGNPLVEPITDAANGLTPIRNADVVSTAYHCQENICMDDQGQVVGTVSLEMRNYLASHPSP